MLGSTGMLVDQCRQIWQEVKKVNFHPEYKKCQNIIICGMGGSAYGGYVINALFKEELSKPLISNNDYLLPNFADSRSLVIVSSYSGSTEEVLSCYQQAKEKGCKIAGIATGGKLSENLNKDNFPALIFDPKFNPSGQPRLGTGYMVLGIAGLLTSLGFITLEDEEVEKAIAELEEAKDMVSEKAQSQAQNFHNFIPVVVAAEFLSGNAHIIRNQINETAKSFSAFSLLSELNHHLMEGLKNPIDKKLNFLFINSDFYTEKLRKRIELTKNVVGKNGVRFKQYKAGGSSKLSQVLNVLAFGGYFSLYLAYLYKQDPSVIPWVDYFKHQLEK